MGVMGIHGITPSSISIGISGGIGSLKDRRRSRCARWQRIYSNSEGRVGEIPRPDCEIKCTTLCVFEYSSSTSCSSMAPFLLQPRLRIKLEAVWQPASGVQLKRDT